MTREEVEWLFDAWKVEALSRVRDEKEDARFVKAFDCAERLRSRIMLDNPRTLDEFWASRRKDILADGATTNAKAFAAVEQVLREIESGLGVEFWAERQAMRDAVIGWPQKRKKVS